MYKQLDKKEAKEICIQAMQNKGEYLKQEGSHDITVYRTTKDGTLYEVQHSTNDSTSVYIVTKHGDEEELDHVFGEITLVRLLGKDENPDKNTIYFQPM